MKYTDGFINLEEVNCQKGMTVLMPGKVRMDNKTNIVEIEGRDYYAKRAGINFYGELLAEEIAHGLDVPCAHYDVAYFNDDAYLISEVKDTPNTYRLDEILSHVYQTENITHYLRDKYVINALMSFFPNLDKEEVTRVVNEKKDDLGRLIITCQDNKLVFVNHYRVEKIYSIEEILKTIYHTDDTSIFNNLYDIKVALEKYFKGHNFDNLEAELNRIYLFDILIANPDRNASNLKVIDDGYNIRFMPLYDNQNCFSHDETTYDSNYTLGVKREKNEESDLVEFLTTFPYMVPILEHYLIVLNAHNIQSALYQIENRTGGRIPQEIYAKYLNEATINASMIEKAINEVNQKQKKM